MFSIFVKEPLTYFLLIGGILFYFNGFEQSDELYVESKEIIVDEISLLTHIQYQMKMFDSDLARKYLTSLSENKRQLFIQSYIREEALYKEALSLGLDNNDYVIKRRLIQKMEFLAANDENINFSIDNDKLLKFYNANKQNYKQDANITFSHRFFKGRNALNKIDKFLKSTTTIDPNNMQVGERFPYGMNFIEQNYSQIRNIFGDKFINEIIKIAPNKGHWSDPVQSSYGWHIIQVIEKNKEFIPPLKSIYEQVKNEFGTELDIEVRENAIQEIIDRYRIITLLKINEEM